MSPLLNDITPLSSIRPIPFPIEIDFMELVFNVSDIEKLDATFAFCFLVTIPVIPNAIETIIETRIIRAIFSSLFFQNRLPFLSPLFELPLFSVSLLPF